MEILICYYLTEYSNSVFILFLLVQSLYIANLLFLNFISIFKWHLPIFWFLNNTNNACPLQLPLLNWKIEKTKERDRQGSSEGDHEEHAGQGIFVTG